MNGLLARAPRPWLPALAAWIATLPLLAVLHQDPGSTPRRAQDALRLRQLEIVDGEGTPRMRLGLEESGTPELCMKDAEGRVRLRARLVGDQEPALILLDDEGKQRVSLVVDKAGNPFVLLAQRGGKPAAQLAVSTLGAPSLVFTHESGAMNAGIGQNADGSGWVMPER